MPAILMALLRLAAGMGAGSLASKGVGKLLSSGAAQKAASSIGGTGAAQALGRGGAAIRGSGVPLAKHFPTAAGTGRNLATGAAGLGAFVGTDALIGGLIGEGSAHDAENLSMFDGQPRPGQANNEAVMANLMQQSQLRDALQMMGIDLDELGSLLPQQNSLVL